MKQDKLINKAFLSILFVGLFSGCENKNPSNIVVRDENIENEVLVEEGTIAEENAMVDIADNIQKISQLQQQVLDLTEEIESALAMGDRTLFVDLQETLQQKLIECELLDTVCITKYETGDYEVFHESVLSKLQEELQEELQSAIEKISFHSASWLNSGKVAVSIINNGEFPVKNVVVNLKLRERLTGDLFDEIQHTFTEVLEPNKISLTKHFHNRPEYDLNIDYDLEVDIVDCEIVK